MGREFNILALVKGNEHYVYIYDDDSGQPLQEAFQSHAADPELSLTWFDAAVLAQKAQEQMSLFRDPENSAARF